MTPATEITTALVSLERIQRIILLLRGEKVILDSDLAVLYRVEVKALNQAVKRNRARFPDDFMFQLTAKEVDGLRSQIVTANERRGGRRTRPYAFTEQGVAMLASVLHSERAIRVNIAIVRAFVELRRMLAGHAALARRLEALERRYDGQFKAVFVAIRELMAEPRVRRRRIGFQAPK